MNDSYTALGSLFEYLNYDCDYEKWSQYLINKLKALGAGNRGVDIGCGNGWFTRALHAEGYDVFGVDISVEMLNTARRIAAEKGARIEFLSGDITKLKVNGRLDFALAVNDCLNYVRGDKLRAAFSRVCGALKKGGIFIFDVSSAEKLENVIGSNTFCDDGDDVTYLWFNSFKGDRVEMDLTFFIKNADGTYRREDERHVQYVHSEEDICSALRDSGFQVLSVEGHLGGEKKERINFICKRL